MKKDASGVLLRPFSVVFTVLSILILAYRDLRFNSKTMPILRQSSANYLPSLYEAHPMRKISWISSFLNMKISHMWEARWEVAKLHR